MFCFSDSRSFLSTSSLSEGPLTFVSSQVESLLSMGLCDQATKHLDRARALAKRYRLDLGTVTVKLLEHVSDVQLSRPMFDYTSFSSTLHQVLHRADRWTRCRCVVFAARVSLKYHEPIVDRLQGNQSRRFQRFDWQIFVSTHVCYLATVKSRFPVSYRVLVGDHYRVFGATDFSSVLIILADSSIRPCEWFSTCSQLIFQLE